MNTTTTSSQKPGRSSRRGRPNEIRFPVIFRLVILASVVGVIGLAYVYLRIQVYAKQQQAEVLEERVVDLRERNRTLEDRIQKYTSVPFLRERLAAGDFDLVSIDPGALVYLDDAAHSPAPATIASVTPAEVAPLQPATGPDTGNIRRAQVMP